MSPLELRFANGRVEGEGEDCVGPFTFSGSYHEDGTVTLIKQYVGRHQVLYRGQHDGEGTIFGRWSLGLGELDEWSSGAFALTPEQRRAMPDAPIREL